ncbi:MAG: hypothetical protein Q9P90_09000 [candidate division KSB1 bacterium]|nr:hypothetical protein [candidate division KSB1 bacterium]
MAVKFFNHKGHEAREEKQRTSNHSEPVATRQNKYRPGQRPGMAGHTISSTLKGPDHSTQGEITTV